MAISGISDRIRLLFVPEKKPFLLLHSILGFYPHNLRLYELALMHKSVTYNDVRGRSGGQQKTAEQEGGDKRPQSAASQRGKNPRPGAASQRKGISQQGEAPETASNARRMEWSPKMTAQNDALHASMRALAHSFPRHINNERLEFLGDAILGAIVADILYKKFGTKQEGFLTNLRSKIVCRNSLNKLAADIGLDRLILHNGAMSSAHNSFMCGNALEAFIGAIYLDRGYKHCYRFIEEKVLKDHINIEQVAKVEQNFKSALIEWCQKRRYKFEFEQKEKRENGNRNTPMFHSSVIVQGVPCGTGDGYTKKESDQQAARQALHRLKTDKNLRNTLQSSTHVSS